MKMNLEDKLAVAGAATGLGLARLIKNTGSVLSSTGKFVVDSAKGTAKVVAESAKTNSRELQLKKR
jgi:glucokinase